MILYLSALLFGIFTSLLTEAVLLLTFLYTSSHIPVERIAVLTGSLAAGCILSNATLSASWRSASVGIIISGVYSFYYVTEVYMMTVSLHLPKNNQLTILGDVAWKSILLVCFSGILGVSGEMLYGRVKAKLKIEKDAI